MFYHIIDEQKKTILRTNSPYQEIGFRPFSTGGESFSGRFNPRGTNLSVQVSAVYFVQRLYPAKSAACSFYMQIYS